MARIVLVDNHGVGQSAPLRSQITVGDLTDDIVSVLDDAGIRSVHVVGVSLGGMIAQELAIEHPKRWTGSCWRQQHRDGRRATRSRSATR